MNTYYDLNTEDGLKNALRNIAKGLDKKPWSDAPCLCGAPLTPKGNCEDDCDLSRSDESAPVRFLGEEKTYDFYVQNEYTIFIPTNAKGLNWCYAHLPEDCPRWGLNGYVIEHRYIDDIVAGAERDGLVSKEAEENFQDEAQHQLQVDYQIAYDEGADITDGATDEEK